MHHHRVAAKTTTASSGTATVTDHRKPPHGRRSRNTPTPFPPVPLQTLRSYNVFTTRKRSNRRRFVSGSRGIVPQDPRHGVREQAQVRNGPIHVRRRERGVCGVRPVLAQREEGVHHAPSERVESRVV